MRLFIAIDFNQLSDYFESLQRQLKQGPSKLGLTRSYHLTLKFLGEVEDGKVESIKDALRKVRFSKFEAKIGNIGIFPDENNMRVVWADVISTDMAALQDHVEDSLKDFNFTKDHEFKAHITLCRIKSVKDKKAFTDSLKKIKTAEKTIQIYDFRLIKSALTSEGPVYETIEMYKQQSREL